MHSHLCMCEVDPQVANGFGAWGLNYCLSFNFNFSRLKTTTKYTNILYILGLAYMPPNVAKYGH